jgi:hypothetical protein
VIFAQNGSTSNYYQDGVLVSTINDLPTYAIINTSFIASYEFDGFIDNLMFFDRALSADEVEAMYEMTSEPVVKEAYPLIQNGKLNLTNTSFYNLRSCDTIDTDAEGYLKCGVDASGDGITNDSDVKFRNITATNISASKFFGDGSLLTGVTSAFSNNSDISIRTMNSSSINLSGLSISSWGAVNQSWWYPNSTTNALILGNRTDFFYPNSTVNSLILGNRTDIFYPNTTVNSLITGNRTFLNNTNYINFSSMTLGTGTKANGGSLNMSGNAYVSKLFVNGSLAIESNGSMICGGGC